MSGEVKTLDYLRKLLEGEQQNIEEEISKEQKDLKDLENEITEINAETTVATGQATLENVNRDEKSSQKMAKLLLWMRNLKKTKQKYSKQAWDPKDLKADIETLSENQNELVDLLTNKSNENFLVDQKQIEDAKRLNRRLTRNIALLKQKYTENTSESGNKLMTEKLILKNKLKTRAGVEDVVLQLYQQIEFLKVRLHREIHQRYELEILLEAEVNELNNLLLLESNSREELRVQLDQALRIRNSVVGDLQLLKGKMEYILDEFESHADKNHAEVVKNMKQPSTVTEMMDIIAMTQDIDSKLATLSELVDPSDLEILSHSDAQTKLIGKLSHQAAEEVAIRKQVQEKNTLLETQIRQLERQVQEERQARLDLEKQVEKLKL